MSTFEGVFPILITPFDNSGNVDHLSFDRTIRFMADIGVNGITILGVLGEANRMLDSERKQLIETAVKSAGGRIPVVVGTSHTGTQSTVMLSQMAESLGASGVMVTPSREPAPNEDRILEYFYQVAESISIPIVLQDHPASTQVFMSVPLILRMISEIPSVACIKAEATPTPAKVSAFLNRMNRDVTILTGLGALYGRYELERGSHGFMTGFAFPEVLIAMVNAAKDERWEDVREIYQRFLPLIVFEQQPGVGIRKEIFRMRGLIDNNTVRHPGANIDGASREQLEMVLETTLPGVDTTKPLEV